MPPQTPKSRSTVRIMLLYMLLYIVTGGAPLSGDILGRIEDASVYPIRPRASGYIGVSYTPLGVYQTPVYHRHPACL